MQRRYCSEKKWRACSVDEKGRELDRFKVPYGANMQVEDGQEVDAGKRLFAWDPHRMPILAEVAGIIRFVDIIDGETTRVEEERKGQIGRACYYRT